MFYLVQQKTCFANKIKNSVYVVDVDEAAKIRWKKVFLPFWPDTERFTDLIGQAKLG